MTRFLIGLVSGLVLISLQSGAAAEPPFDPSKPIVEIEWRGKANLGQDEFLDLIGIQVGDTLERDTIRRGLEKLYLKGFFSQIRIEVTSVQEGLKLTYYTTPNALIQRYQISGNKAVSKRSLLERIRPQAGEPFSEHRLTVSLDALQQFYAEQGFPHATITWRLQKSDDLTEATISLTIDEGPPLEVTEIRLEEVSALSAEDLLRRFRVRSGRPLSTETLQRDLDRLRSRYRREGYLSVRTEDPHVARDLKQNVAAVSVTVVEGPKISVAFAGNRKVSSKILRASLPGEAVTGYSEDLLLDMERAMLQLYRARGFAFTIISHEVEEHPDTGDLSVRFLIAEGPQVTVKALAFVGNQTLSPTEIRSQFLTQERRLFGAVARGLYLEEQLDKDLEAVQFLYRRRGFLQAHVSRELAFSADRSQVTIRVSIEEGVRTLVSSVTLEGEETIAEEVLRPLLSLQPGDPLDEGRGQEDAERLRAYYERQGYPDVRVTLDRSLANEGRSAHFTYRIQEGRPTAVGDIIIQGNYRTQVEVITRELTFAPGEPLSRPKLFESRRKLSRLALFSRIAMDPRLEEVPGERDVLIQLTERKPKALNFGIGYSSEEQVRGFVEFLHSNIDGMHRQFRLRAQASFREQTYLMSFREPRLFGTLVSSTLGLSRAEEERGSFSVRRDTAHLGFERPLGEHYRAFLTYSLDVEHLFDVEPGAIISEVDRGRLTIASILGTLQRDTRDRIVDPHSGSLQRLTVEVADLLLGSEVSFVKLTGATHWFFPLLWETVGAVSLRGGVAQAFGSAGEVPISRRFFLGGSTTVRGYDFERIGPAGPDGTPTGGDVFVVTNLEWRVPLYKGFGIVLFTDIGNVFRAIDNFVPGHIKGSAGLGLRYNTPIGPIRLDYGRKLAPAEREASGRFHFSVGHPF